MSASSLERRRSERVPLTVSVELRDGRGFSLHASRHFSRGGVFFDRAIPHAAGTVVRFCLPGDSRPLQCAGEVVNVPDATAFGTGVRFWALAPDDLARLLAFLDLPKDPNP